jgi:hypothetical protein
VAVGNAGFDAADRLAINNLLGAYAHTYDEDRLDEFRALFTESPELVLGHDGSEASSDIETVMRLLELRKAAFKAENNQRRHALNSIWFTSQTATEATGRCYFQVFAIRDGGAPNAEVTGYYEFTAVKRDEGWRFGRWVLKDDQL